MEKFAIGMLLGVVGGALLTANNYKMRALVKKSQAEIQDKLDSLMDEKLKEMDETAENVSESVKEKAQELKEKAQEKVQDVKAAAKEKIDDLLEEKPKKTAAKRTSKKTSSPQTAE
jgi:predicted Holliday junction resolvase-like endonuclease